MSGDSNFRSALANPSVLMGLKGTSTAAELKSNLLTVGSKKCGKGTKMVLQPAYQTYTTLSKRDTMNIPIAPAFPGSFFTGNTPFTWNWTPGGVEVLKHMRFLFNLSESGGSSSVTMCPPALAFQRIDLIQDGQVVYTSYGENLWMDTNLWLSQPQYQNMASLLGQTSSWAPLNSGNGSLVIPASGNANYEVPFFSPIDVFNPTLKESKIIQFKFYPRNAVVTGSGTLNVVSASLVLDHQDMYNVQFDMLQKLYNDNILKFSYLDHQQATFTGTFTASTKTLIDLSTLTGKVAFLLIMLRSSVAPAGNGYSTLASIGTQNRATLATIGLQNPSGNDILNHGTSLSVLDLAYHNARYFANTMFVQNQNIYPLVFCNDVQRAMRGDQSSFFYFDGTKYQAAVTPDSGFATGTYTCDVWAYYFKSVEIEDGVWKPQSN